MAALKVKAGGPPNGSDWQSVESISVQSIRNRGIFMDITGLEGGGKSSLAMTLAELGPIGYVNLDQSADRARKPNSKKAREGIKVLSTSYAASPNEEETKRICGEAWVGMERKVTRAAADWAAGIVLDTGTEDWELIRLGSFGTLNPRGNRMDRLYGPVNARYRMHLRNVYRTSRKHLVTIHQLKDEYQDKFIEGKQVSIRTGNYKPAGFKEIGYLCDLRVRCFREDGEFKAEVELCKLPPNGPDLEGTVLEGDDIDFAHIVGMATGLGRDEWLRK